MIHIYSQFSNWMKTQNKEKRMTPRSEVMIGQIKPVFCYLKVGNRQTVSCAAVKALIISQQLQGDITLMQKSQMSRIPQLHSSSSLGEVLNSEPKWNRDKSQWEGECQLWFPLILIRMMGVYSETIIELFALNALHKTAGCVLMAVKPEQWVKRIFLGTFIAFDRSWICFFCLDKLIWFMYLS